MEYDELRAILASGKENLTPEQHRSIERCVTAVRKWIAEYRIREYPDEAAAKAADEAADDIELALDDFFAFGCLADRHFIDADEDDVATAMACFINSVDVISDLGDYPECIPFISRAIEHEDLSFDTLWSLCVCFNDWMLTGESVPHSLYFNCLDAALETQVYGLVGGFALVDMISRKDNLRLMMFDYVINRDNPEYNPLLAASRLFSYRTDRLAFAHLCDEADDRFEILFAELTQNPDLSAGDGYDYYLGMMYLHGIGTDIDLASARTHLERALRQDSKYLSYVNRELTYLERVPACLKSAQDDLTIGDAVVLGSYNHRKIIWKVIDKDEEKTTLLSLFALESTYVMEKAVRRFTSCTCFLPEVFMSAYFLREDMDIEDMLKEKILTCGETSYRKKLFLPTVDELNKAFKTPEERVCYARDQALINGYDSCGVEYDEDTEFCVYLVRGSEDPEEYFVVDTEGELYEVNYLSCTIGLRPAVYLLNKSADRSSE